MSSVTMSAGSTLTRVSRIVLAAVGILVTASSLYVLAVPVDPEFFDATVGVSWAQFSAANPDVVAYMEREARLLGVGFMGLGLLTAGLAWRLSPPYDLSAAITLWVVPLALGAATLVILQAGVTAVFWTYAILAVIAALAVLGLTASTARSEGR